MDTKLIEETEGFIMEGHFASQDYIDMAEQNLIQTYNRYQIVFDKGEGMYLYDVNGKKYLDFVAGIAVFALGYGCTPLNEALKAQIDKLVHTSNYFYSAPLALAAEKVVKNSGMDKVFFTNSGTEALEGAIKLARKYAYNRDHFAAHEIIAMGHSFHGRSMGALSVTGTAKYREAFEPLIGGVKFAEFNDLESVKAQVTQNTCAILLEPVQGEGGIYPADPAFLKGIRDLCTEKDILLIFDEVQCGMGRTGSMFAWQGYGVKPDILAMAKALGCGVPVGAFAATDKVAEAMVPGDHGTTYGGNPFACAAVSKILDLYDEMDILNHVNQVAPYLEEQLDKLAAEYSFVKTRRGKGLMQGLELTIPVGDIILKGLELGLVLISAGEKVIRFVPPLIVTKEHIDEMIPILRKALDITEAA